MTEYKDYPIKDCQKKADEILRMNPHARIYQKFSCENCGERLGIDDPNVFYATGQCDKCGHVTDLEKRGCNYMVVIIRRTE